MDYSPIKSNFAVMKHPLEKFRYCPVCGSPEFEVNNVKSKKCRACGFTYYMNPSAATVAVIVKKTVPSAGMGKGEGLSLLVVRRGKEPAKGTLDLPGGFSDMDETSEEGVIREVMEETGLNVTHTEFLFSQPNRYVYSGLEIPTMDMFYLCTVSRTEGAHAMDDAAECMWIPFSELNPDDFGLDSIRRGVQLLLHRFLKKVQNTYI